MEDIPYDKLILIVRRQENDLINHRKRINELEARTDPRRDTGVQTSPNRIYHIVGDRPMGENIKDWSNDIHNMKLRLETVRDGQLQVIRIQTNTMKGYEHMAWIDFEGRTNIDEKETDILKDYGYRIVGIKIDNGWLSVRVSNK